ncbi:MAG: hypothetical protein QM758_05560 [Armatimonas sp.]
MNRFQLCAALTLSAILFGCGGGGSGSGGDPEATPTPTPTPTPTATPTPIPASGKIAFLSTRTAENPQENVWVMNADGTGATQIAPAITVGDVSDVVEAKFSPDGKKIAYADKRMGFIGIIDLAMTKRDIIWQESASDNSYTYLGGLTWSPDATKIAFHSNRENGVRLDNIHIYVVNTDGSSVSKTRLTNVAANDTSPSWSPNGTQILFASTRDKSTQVYVMNADGTNQTRLTNTTSDPAAEGDFRPVWSPDGNRIAFTRFRQTGPLSSASYLYTMNSNGSGQTQVLTFGLGGGNWCWSPDGRKFAFDSPVSGTTMGIFTANADGSGIVPITDASSANTAPTWR